MAHGLEKANNRVPVRLANASLGTSFFRDVARVESKGVRTPLEKFFSEKIELIIHVPLELIKSTKI